MAGVAGLPATFTTAQARRAGVQFRDLYAARDAGELLELSRGVFRRADAPLPTFPDLLAVAYRAPRAVVCLLSAAAVHDLTDEPVRVYSPTRTVVDLMRLRARIGEPVAHIALRRYLTHRDARVGELVDLAATLDVLGPVRSALDVLTAS